MWLYLSWLTFRIKWWKNIDSVHWMQSFQRSLEHWERLWNSSHNLQVCPIFRRLLLIFMTSNFVSVQSWTSIFASPVPASKSFGCFCFNLICNQNFFNYNSKDFFIFDCFFFWLEDVYWSLVLLYWMDQGFSPC